MKRGRRYGILVLLIMVAAGLIYLKGMAKEERPLFTAQEASTKRVGLKQDLPSFSEL
jgi:hypothetical protein